MWFEETQRSPWTYRWWCGASQGYVRHWWGWIQIIGVVHHGAIQRKGVAASIMLKSNRKIILSLRQLKYSHPIINHYKFFSKIHPAEIKPEKWQPKHSRSRINNLWLYKPWLINHTNYRKKKSCVYKKKTSLFISLKTQISKYNQIILASIFTSFLTARIQFHKSIPQK